MNLTLKDQVSIVVPTLNRPHPLKRALRSVLDQVLPDNVRLEIVVVDNSVDRSAEWILTDPEISSHSSSLRYESEPAPGVANARNAGLRAARGRWIAFLDDDEEATPTWLANHIETLRKTGADASFGPVIAKAEEGEPARCLMAFFSRSLSRSDKSDITDLYAYLGTNNSVFDRKACLSQENVFDTSLNETGGEDSLLLCNLALEGRKFAWSALSAVTEWVPSRRANWTYVRRRRFLSGQIRSLVNYKLASPRWSRIAFWMMTGGLQAVGWYVASFPLLLLDREHAERARAKSCGGLGKLFWSYRFSPRLYGAGLVS